MKQMRLSKAFSAKMAAMALFLGMGQSVSAQQFTAKVPATNRFVMITSDGVNVRRLPNATSGKVMTWSSDGGSIDTYTKIYFSDTEARLYRANSMTGAYVDSYHPAKNSYLPVSANQVEPQNGWYNVLVTADEYAGNPGKANAKYAWVKGDFCKVVDVDQSVIPAKTISIPQYKYWDGENDRMGYGPETLVSKIFYRGNSMRVLASIDTDNSSVNICIPFVCGNYVLVARTSVAVEHDPSVSGTFRTKLETIENDMGDEDKVFKIYMKSNEDILNKALRTIIGSPDMVFDNIVKLVCPNGVIPTDEVYFMGKDGKRHEISYNANVTGAGNAFQVKTLSFGK